MDKTTTRALTLPHSNAACHQLTLLTGRKKFTHAMKISGRLMQAHFIKIHKVFAKKKLDTFLTDLVHVVYLHTHT